MIENKKKVLRERRQYMQVVAHRILALVTKTFISLPSW